MKWFKHDTDATADAKVKKLVLRYGPVGYAIYFHCLELIAGSISDKNVTFELEHDSEIIADDLKVQGTASKSAIELVEEIMLYIINLGLFSESNNRIFCFQLLNRLDSSMTSNKAMRQLIVSAKESHDGVMTESAEPMQEETRLEETRLEKKRTKKETVPRFRADVFLSKHCSDKQLIQDWLKVRDKKKAANTETAMNRFIAQVEKSGMTCEDVLGLCCENSWKGFKAEWVKDRQFANQNSVGIAMGSNVVTGRFRGDDI